MGRLRVLGGAHSIQSTPQGGRVQFPGKFYVTYKVFDEFVYLQQFPVEFARS